MKKFYILLLVFALFACKKEEKNQEENAIPVVFPVIHPEGRAVEIDSALVASYASKTLEVFYSATLYKSVWQSKKDRKIILEQLRNSNAEGLNPADYKITKLQQYEIKASSLSDADKAKYDVLLTYCLQKYIRHLTHGRLSPKVLYSDWDLIENKIDVNTALASLLISDSLAVDLNRLKPQHEVYLKLKKALKIINSYSNGDFKQIKISNKIVPKDTNSSLIAIKKRLIYWKDLRKTDSVSAVYDAVTVQAVKKFQSRHGLSADGVIGKGTVESLNFSKSQRKEQIIANLERWKWFPKDLGEEYLIVNIPEYRLSAVKNKDTIRTHRVVVGRAERKTPILSSKLSYAVFNPTWTVPPTIKLEDMIPAIEKSRAYLSATNIKVFDSKGNEVSADNWNLANAKGYRYVQSPGKSNSLGVVKLLFPNRFSVYLHDTNHRDYFVKNMRSLSSGCVRVENPLELTAYVLSDTVNWNPTKISELLLSQKTKYVKVNKAVYVHLLYWTAWSEKNNLCFRDDIYGLDFELYKKLRN